MYWFLLISCVVVVYSLPPKRIAFQTECLDECMPCDSPLDCPNGKVMDTCGCCEQCVMKIGEPCGTYGVCDNDLFCTPVMGTNESICQPVMCEGIICGKYQTCIEQQDGVRSCECAFDCTRSVGVPFCGADGWEYNSMCDIQLRECETGDTFVYMPGKCERCKRDGKKYKEGELLSQSDDDETPCLEEVCAPGSTKKFRLNNICLIRKNYTCTIGDVFPGLNCAPQYACKITKRSDDMPTFPHLGECVNEKDFCYRDGEAMKRNESYVTRDCRSRCTCKGNNLIKCTSFCPPVVLADCGDDETAVTKEFNAKDESCTCPSSGCVKNTEVCKMEKKQGECYAYFENWYYNTETEKCDKFIYGGCNGNANRFDTKAECERKCVFAPKEIVQVEPIKVKPSSVVPLVKDDEWTWPNANPAIIKKSSTTMTVRGRVTFAGLKQTLPPPSCLFLFLEDISRMDASSTVIGFRKFNVSNFDTTNNFVYSLKTKKPVKSELWRTYGMEAIVHVGYCPEKRSSIRAGDYITDAVHRLAMKMSDNEYVLDVTAVCYDCEKVEEKGREIIETNQDTVTPFENKSAIKLLGNEGPCTFEGKKYNFLEQFSNENCTGLCQCGVNGKVLCVPLCEPRQKCRDGMEEEITTIPHSKEWRCTCKVRTCKIKECLHQGERYVTNTKFIDKSCQAFCKCEENGHISCVSLCPPMQVRCSPGETITTVKQPVLDSNCTCDRDICVGTSPRDILMPPTIMDDETEYKMEEENKEKDLEGKEEDNGKGEVDVTDEETETDLVWPDGDGVDVKLDKNRTIVVRGKIIFSETVGELPSPSCLRIKLEDISRTDVSSSIIFEEAIDLSGKTIGNVYNYSITSYKPIEKQLWGDHAISVVLNKGWCKGPVDNREWIREGDFLTTSRNEVVLEKDRDTYNVDVDAECYGKEDDDGEETDTDFVWPDGDGVDVKLDKNRTIVVRGKIIFSETVGELPSPSCLRIKLEDVSMTDVSSSIIFEEAIDLSGKTIGNEYNYNITSYKPIEKQLLGDHAISVVLNKGWCKGPVDNREWLREGDFLTTSRNEVVLEKDRDTYNVDVDAECYECDVISDDCSSVCNKQANLACSPDQQQIITEELVDGTDCVCSRKECFNVTVVTSDVAPISKPSKCYHKGKSYKDGETWNKDPCTSCSCDNGQQICAIEDCAPSLCENPVLKEGDCCPICEESTCYDEITETTYEEGEEWTSDNGCMKCTCLGKTPMCATPMCVMPKCEQNSTIVTVEGVCCPMCSNTKLCTVKDGKKYREGQIWQDDERCQVCHCQGDSISCLAVKENKEVIEEKKCTTKTRLNKHCDEVCYDEIKEMLSKTSTAEP